MLNKALVMLLLLLAGSVVLVGGWTSLASPPAPLAESAFIPQVVELDADVLGSNVSASQLLEKALDRLKPERAPWMRTKIRQTMSDAKCRFSAAGFLQRGPGNCARLEMEVLSHGKRAKLLIVSDGHSVAEVKKIPDLPAVERVTQLAPDLLQGTPVIQIKGDFNAYKLPAFAVTSSPIRIACVYLDASTLWPVQLEWWGGEKNEVACLILKIEFSDPELNRELSFEECSRLFSYRPEGNVGTVEVE
jgi:hypothetical protein